MAERTSKPQDPRDPEDVLPAETIRSFRRLLDQYPRIAIAGGPRCGKSMLGRLTKDRRLFTAQEFEPPPGERSPEKFSAVPHEMLAATAGLDRFVIEGVMVARYLRKAAQLDQPCPVDAVVWLDEPKVQQNDGQARMKKTIAKWFRDWVELVPKMPPVIREGEGI